jgi:hypothetical protein
MIWYLEQRMLGRWAPVLQTTAPVTVTRAGKTLLAGNSGHQPEVRALSKVAEEDRFLDLGQLAAIYGPDGAHYDPARIARVNA